MKNKQNSLGCYRLNNALGVRQCALGGGGGGGAAFYNTTPLFRYG